MNQLPSEVLGLIFGVSSTSYLVISLWKCGDRALHYKLAQGVTCMHLSALQGFSSKWPLMLSHLRSLRSLTIHAKEPMFNNTIHANQCLKSLNQSLKTLQIESPDFLECFLNPDPDFPDCLATTSYQRGESRFIDLEKLFPRLTSLEICDPTDDPFTTNTVHDSDLAALPDSLTKLSLPPYVLFDDNRGLFHALPRSLLSLKGAINLPSYPHSPSLPPNLTAIGKIECHSLAFPLPETITAGTVQLTQCSTMCLSNLPQSLESLTLTQEPLGSGDKMWVLELPNALQQLELKFPPDWHQTALIRITSLPRSLTSLSLDVSKIDWTAFKDSILQGAPNQISWPPRLSEFKLTSSQYQPEIWMCLPQSITKLVASITDHRQRHLILDANQLPAGLKVFTLNAAQNAVKLQKRSLPWSLERFTCSCHFTTLYNVRTPKSLLTSVTSLHIRTSHISSNTLNMSQFDKVSELTRLTKLIVAQWPCSKLTLLPRSLSSIRIGEIIGSVEDSNTEELFEAFVDLPPSLVALTISYSKLFFPLRFSVQSFASLPALRQLLMGLELVFSSAVLRSLPRDMQRLHLPFHQLESADLPYIPQKLLHFAPRCRIDWSEPSVAEFWPWRETVFPTDCPQDFKDLIREKARHLSQ